MSNMRTAAPMIVLTIASLLSGCRDAPLGDSSSPKSNSSVLFDALLQRAATEYRTFSLVNLAARPAPAACLAPSPWTPASPRLSRSTHDATHGRKLYFLYVKDFQTYFTIEYSATGPWRQPNELAKPGQILVKESWTPIHVGSAADAPPRAYARPPQPRRVEHTEIDGHIYRTGQQADLFIMLKLDPATPDTDNGWVYGTVSPNGKTVTSAGRVESCMKCHLEAPHDRLFGPYVYTRR